MKITIKYSINSKNSKRNNYWEINRNKMMINYYVKKEPKSQLLAWKIECTDKLIATIYKKHMRKPYKAKSVDWEDSKLKTRCIKNQQKQTIESKQTNWQK